MCTKQNTKSAYSSRRRHPRYRRHRRSFIFPNPLFFFLPIVIVMLAVGVKADQKVAEFEKPSTTAEKISLFYDRTKPQISGIKDLYTYVGETISYREGITVTDNLDTDPLLSVDSSGVNLSQPGIYEAVYTAKDASGNKTKEIITVTVLEKEEGFVDMSTIHAAVDAQLSRILMSEMTQYQQVEAIYQWARNYLMYSDHTTRAPYHQAGYEMLTTGQGDCYGYFAVTKLMLERLGIPNIDVEKVKRSETDSSHFWSLVSVDGGKTYYHLDTTPRLGGDDVFLLVSDSDLDAYSAAHNYSHNRDLSLYPTTPENSYGE